MLKRNRKTLGIPEVLHHVRSLHEKAKRMTYLLGYRSCDISKCFRHTISTCNSVAIVFLQFDLLEHALQVLQRAVLTDVCLFFEGEFRDRAWYGRALLYTNLGFLLQKVGDYQSSLKFLYDAESLTLEPGSECSSPAKDLTLGHALLTFIVLCKINKTEQAEEYLELAISEFNAISKKERHSKISGTGCANLYCLLTLATEVLKGMKTGEFEGPRKNCAELLLQEGDENSAVHRLVARFAHEEGLFILQSEEFASLVYITVFFPFIAPNTPVIHFDELNRAQEQSNKFPMDQCAMRELLSRGEGRRDTYSLIMREALNHMSKN